MKTTLDIDDRLLRRAKAEAARRHLTLTHLVEQGIALRLRVDTAAVPRRRKVTLPVCKATGGLLPHVDPLSNRSLYAAMDE